MFLFFTKIKCTVCNAVTETHFVIWVKYIYLILVGKVIPGILHLYKAT